MMNKAQAQAWTEQEFAKLDSVEKKKEHLVAYAASQDYFNSPVGIARGKAEPHAREARHELARRVEASLKA